MFSPPRTGQFTRLPTGSSPTGSGVSQTFTTQSGAKYYLVFDHGTYVSSPRDAVIGVTIGTNFFTIDQTDGGVLSSYDWREVVYPFFAPGSATTLTFTNLADTNTPADDGLIDNVQVYTADSGRVLQTTTSGTGSYSLAVAGGNTYTVGVTGLSPAYAPIAPTNITVAGVNVSGVNFTPLTNSATTFTISNYVSAPGGNVPAIVTGAGVYTNGAHK